MSAFDLDVLYHPLNLYHHNPGHRSEFTRLLRFTYILFSITGNIRNIRNAKVLLLMLFWPSLRADLTKDFISKFYIF